MWNASPVKLRNKSVFLRELTIGQAIEIAKIPESMNEARLTSFIGFVCDEDAFGLTVQERYFILLNYLTMAQNDYVLNIDDDRYFLPVLTADDEVSVDGLVVRQMTGRQAMVLETKCENIFEWLCGQMACQLVGEVGAYVGVDETSWEALPDEEYGIDEMVAKRFEWIHNLTQEQFDKLAAVYFAGVDKLAHLVQIGFDNQGLTLLSVGGDVVEAARFCPDVCFTESAERLSSYLA